MDTFIIKMVIIFKCLKYGKIESVLSNQFHHSSSFKTKTSLDGKVMKIDGY